MEFVHGEREKKNCWKMWWNHGSNMHFNRTHAVGKWKKNVLYGNHFDEDFSVFFFSPCHMLCVHKGQYWSNDIDYKSQKPVASVSKMTSFRAGKKKTNIEFGQLQKTKKKICFRLMISCNMLVSIRYTLSISWYYMRSTRLKSPSCWQWWNLIWLHEDRILFCIYKNLV